VGPLIDACEGVTVVVIVTEPLPTTTFDPFFQYAIS
jgi:hypothetical protein